jgi:hypothetical protein
VGQLRRIVELDVPAARGVLAKIIDHLEQYQLERPPEAFSPRNEAMPSATEATTRTPATAPDQGAKAAETAAPVDEVSASEATQ